MKKIYFNLLLSFLYPAIALGQTFESSNLPIIFITTMGTPILDDPKVKAEMKIIYNGPGKTNSLKDAPNHYNGFIGVEYRGSSSQMFPKKSLGIELWDDKGKSKDASLFGMPEESDWILFASYNEKSLMHNVLTMNLARQMGIYASRTQSCLAVKHHVAAENYTLRPVRVQRQSLPSYVPTRKALAIRRSGIHY